jgi:hypothetical protein
MGAYLKHLLIIFVFCLAALVSQSSAPISNRRSGSSCSSSRSTPHYRVHSRPLDGCQRPGHRFDLAIDQRKHCYARQQYRQRRHSAANPSLRGRTLTL